MAKQAQPETLADVAVGTKATIERVTCTRAVTVRLYEMGLVPGTEVTVTRVAPLGDPLELEVRGYNLSIRRHEARGVRVGKAEGP